MKPTLLPDHKINFRQVKKNLYLYSWLLFLFLPFIHLFNLDALIFGFNMSVALPHYNVFTLLFVGGFSLTMIFTAIYIASDATFNPKTKYADVYNVKHLDTPAVPNLDEVYAYMHKADKMELEGGRPSQAELDHYRVDGLGNMY